MELLNQPAETGYERRGCQPVQGADRINDELEVGFDAGFERRWVWVQRAGVTFMLAIAIASLFGLLGRGPFSHRTERTAESGLAVDFEPVAREQTPTQVTLHLHNDTESPEMQVFIGTTTIEPMGLTRILPQPVSTRSVVGGLVVSVAVPPGTTDALLRLILQPGNPGLIQQQANLVGQPPIRWTQLVLP